MLIISIRNLKGSHYNYRIVHNSLCVTVTVTVTVDDLIEEKN